MFKKNVHVFKTNKFVSSYIEMISSEPDFRNQDHVFWVSGDIERYPLPQHCEAIVSRGFWGRPYSFFKLFLLILRSDKIILHGLFDRGVVHFLFFNMWALRKSYWAIWGADLYGELHRKKKLKDRIHSFYKRAVIKRIGHLVTHVKGDVDIAREVFSNKGCYHHCILYNSNLFDYVADEEYKPVKVGIDILVGNSADPSNNHIDVFQRLACLESVEFRVHSPLSYGKTKYCDLVVESGRSMFGRDFYAVKDFMGYDEYLEFLSAKDVAIFNHKRQQALGNIINLLGMGKFVFLRKDIATWDYMAALGVKVFDVCDIADIESIVKCDVSGNVDIIKKEFCRENLIKQWDSIFSR